MKHSLKTVILVFVFSLVAYATDSVLLVFSEPKDLSGIVFRFSTPLENAKGGVTEINGFLQVDEQTNVVKSGGFAVPIASMDTGNKKRNCHMIEALGLDYKKSGFPAEHVCDGDNNLPKSGPNSVVFPEIALLFLDFTLEETGEPFKLGENKIQKLVINARWMIRDQTRDVVLKATVTQDKDKVTFEGKTSLSLNDFGIIVKKAGPIAVNDEVKVQVKTTLAVQRKP